MELNNKQKIFPGTVQKSIWHTAQFVSPFYETIPPNGKIAEGKQIIKGEKDFYEFMLGLYSDMYKDPKHYFIPAEKYDNYMKGRVKAELPHKNDSRECSLRNIFQKSIKFYQDFFYEIGKRGEVDPKSFNLYLPEVEFEEIINNLKITKQEKQNLKRVDALKRLGLASIKLNANI